MRNITMIILIVISWVLSIQLLAHATCYTLIDEAQAYLRQDFVIEGKVVETYEKIPDTLGKPEYLIIGNAIHTVWYEKGLRDEM